MRRPAPSREEFFRTHPKGGRMPRHGGGVFGDAATWGAEQAATVTDTPSAARPPPRCGTGRTCG